MRARARGMIISMYFNFLSSVIKEERICFKTRTEKELATGLFVTGELPSKIKNKLFIFLFDLASRGEMPISN